MSFSLSVLARDEFAPISVTQMSLTTQCHSQHGEKCVMRSKGSFHFKNKKKIKKQIFYRFLKNLTQTKNPFLIIRLFTASLILRISKNPCFRGPQQLLKIKYKYTKAVINSSKSKQFGISCSVSVNKSVLQLEESTDVFHQSGDFDGVLRFYNNGCYCICIFSFSLLLAFRQIINLSLTYFWYLFWDGWIKLSMNYHRLDFKNS